MSRIATIRSRTNAHDEPHWLDGRRTSGVAQRWAQKLESLMRRKIALRILILIVATAGAVLLLRPSATQPSCLVMVSFTAITKDASGTRQATFRVENAGRHAVSVVPIYCLENRSGRWRTNLVPAKATYSRTSLMGMLPFHPLSKRLSSGDSCKVTLSLPFDDLGWRASFWYVEVRSPMEEKLHWLSRRFGWKNKDHGQLIASTDWVDR